jgi:hypothetical protein
MNHYSGYGHHDVTMPEQYKIHVVAHVNKKVGIGITVWYNINIFIQILTRICGVSANIVNIYNILIRRMVDTGSVIQMNVVKSATNAVRIFLTG